MLWFNGLSSFTGSNQLFLGGKNADCLSKSFFTAHSLSFQFDLLTKISLNRLSSCKIQRRGERDVDTNVDMFI